MLLALHTLSEAYKLLPSEALARASTFDLHILELHHKYIKYQEHKDKGLPRPTPKLSVDKMKAMMERAKNFKPRSNGGTKVS
jgi:hypothetical protein